MFYLLLSVLCSATLSIVMRLSEGKIQSKVSMLAANYLTCFLITGCFMDMGGVSLRTEGMGAALAMGVINGIFYMLSLLLHQYSISKNGIVLSSIFSKMGGLLIPLAISIFLFREMPTAFQVVGFILAIAAILLINYRKNGGTGSKQGAILLVLLVTEGFAGVMAKVFRELGNEVLGDHFLFFTFVSAFLICAWIVAMKKERPGKRELFYGIMIGVPNFMASRFMLKALESVAAVIVYPTRSVGGIVLIALAGILFFKERLTKTQLAALVVTLVALVLLNL